MKLNTFLFLLKDNEFLEKYNEIWKKSQQEHQKRI